MSPRKKELLHIYRRVSTKGQEGKYSLGIQLKKGKSLSKKLKLDYKDWSEGGKSGSSENIEEREVLSELFLHIQEGKVKHLFVQDLSRLSRNPMVSSMLRVELEKHEVKLYTDNSEMDFGSDEQTLLYDFMSSINQFFVKIQTKKSKLGKVEHFKRGGYRGGTFPMGYKSKKVDGLRRLVIVPKESEYIRKIFEWYDNDKTIKQIGRILDKDKFPPRRSKVWNFQSIVNILRNPLYIGVDTMVDKTRKDKDGNYPIMKNIDESMRIVDDKLFGRVQQKIEDILTIRNQLRRMKHEVLLRGKLWCDSCGSIFGVRVKPQKNERYYYCRSKENNWRELNKKKIKKCDIKKSLNIPNTDSIVWETLVNILGDSHHIKEIIKEQEFQKKKELESKTDNTELLKKLNSSKRTILRKIKDYDERGDENREWYLGGEITKVEYEKGIKIIEKGKSEYWNKYRQIDLKIQNIKDKKLWIEWLDTHSSWVKNIHKIESIEEKTELLNKYVNRIMVTFNEDKNLHSLEMNLKIPMVNDSYKVVDSSGGKRNYEIISGSSYYTTKVSPPKRGCKVKKKSKNDEVVKSNITEDTRIPPLDSNPLLWNRIKRGYYLTCRVKISSPRFWIRPLPKKQIKIFQIISELRDDKGMTYPQISDFLNNSTNLTPKRSKRGFYPPIVQSIYSKMNKREERIKQIPKPIIYDVGLMIE